jgi:hypothetical protein
MELDMNAFTYILAKTSSSFPAWLGASALVWLATKSWIAAGWLPKELVNPYNLFQYHTILFLCALVPTVVISRSSRWLLCLTSSLLVLQSLVFCVLLTLFIENNIISHHNITNFSSSVKVDKMRNFIQKNKPSFADILISSAFVLTLIVTIPDQLMHSLLTVFTKTQVHIAWFLLAVLLTFSKKGRFLIGFIIATQSILAGLFCLILLFAGRFQHSDNENETSGFSVRPVDYTFDANGVLGPNCSGSRECSR